MSDKLPNAAPPPSIPPGSDDGWFRDLIDDIDHLVIDPKKSNALDDARHAELSKISKDFHKS